MADKLDGKIKGVPPDPGNVIKTFLELPEEHQRPFEEALRKSAPQKKEAAK